MHDSFELEFLPPLTPDDVPTGVYLAAFVKASLDHYRGQRKIRLDFELIEPASVTGLIVSLWCTHPHRDLNRRHSKRSKFYKLWIFANGGPPKRGQRMTMKVFHGYWKVRVRWGVSNGDGGLPKGAPTSPVVDALLEREAGGPVTHVDHENVELVRTGAPKDPTFSRTGA